ncbi:hypothetical protein MHLP_04140 [Candidatus Mycoplasma haematolamae str. Purdue]|uniref:Uncharacterized protein n=1 Tax=Mycoplasma haematolamae (strain Purdue) TaxID=1212765 RepID=I7BKI9_MYCHA|nr:hypothetical protein [Candidatus Mycoplasma haematolamae]AFO52408.1 hypothetical protein MHLP_04140 [Candidatus Mycoplasma haematolamae str. Purdue]
MAPHKIVQACLGILTASSVGGIAYSSLPKQDLEARDSNPGVPETTLSSTPPSVVQTQPSETARNASSVTPRPEIKSLNYKFVSGSKSLELNCPNNQHPNSGFEGSKKLILCQAEKRQDSLNWYSPSGSKTQCEWEPNKNSYKCTSPKSQLAKYSSTKNREAIQII